MSRSADHAGSRCRGRGRERGIGGLPRSLALIDAEMRQGLGVPRCGNCHKIWWILPSWDYGLPSWPAVYMP
jgi:hypothetical protein